MAKKEFKYRGYNLEQVKGMNMEEFTNSVTARMRRTIKRGFPQRHKKLVHRARKNPDTILRTHCRDMLILPEFIGRTFAVHNGKEFVRLLIEPEMIGLYFGEFVMTRKRVQHSSPGMGATKASKFVSLK